MNRPAGRKSNLSKDHPAAPEPASTVTPPAAPERRTAAAETTKDRTKVSFYTTQETAGQVRAALTHVPAAAHGYRNISDLIDDAVNEKIQQLQQRHNQGQPWPAADPGTVSRGRPLE